VEDVFSTYLYTGNGAEQRIENGIDLENEGGMVWIKNRDQGNGHAVFDTSRGIGKYISTSSAASESIFATWLNAFNQDGFSIGSTSGNVNELSDSYVSWTFREAPGFFDIVTYTGDGTSGRQIEHDLGMEPGMWMIKRLDAQSDAGWAVWHRKDGEG